MIWELCFACGGLLLYDQGQSKFLKRCGGGPGKGRKGTLLAGH